MPFPVAFWKPGAAVYDPAVLALSGWWRASYAGAPWAARASAGASLANGDLVAGSAPATGSAQNGLTPADCNGSSHYLTNPNDMTVLFTAAAGTAISLIWVDAGAPAAGGNPFEDEAVWSDTNGAVGLAVNADGLRAFNYDGDYDQPATQAVSTGAYHLVMVRWNSTNVGITIDSASEVTASSGALNVTSGTLNVGSNYDQSAFFDGRILELMTAASALTNGNYASVKSYVNSRYALAL